MSINRGILAAAAAVTLAAGAAIASDNEASSADLWIQKSGNGFTVEYVSDGRVAGLQFDVKGIKVVDGQFDCGTSVAESHTASCSINSDGNLRVIVFSMTNEVLPDGTMVTIAPPSRDNTSRMQARQLAAASEAESVALDGVLFADAQGADVTPDHLQ
ncbi:hypothetical protein [Halomonas denitrificans]|nr:hypothetical protein [Halomonas denitrificans]